MTEICANDSITCKLLYGIVAAFVAALLCIAQGCFQTKLKKWLEENIGDRRKYRVNFCFSVSNPSTVSNGGERYVGMVRIPTNPASPQRMQMNVPNSWQLFATNVVPQNLHNVTTTVMNNASSVSVSPHSTTQSGLATQHQVHREISQYSHMSHMMLVQEYSDGRQDIGLNMDQARRGQHQRPISVSSANQQISSSGSEHSKNTCLNQIFSRFFYFIPMLLFLYDWCADLILSHKYFIREEYENFSLTLAPSLISVIFSIPFLLYIAKIHKKLSCLSGLLILGISPIAKVFIYGWIVVVGEQSWYQRWYLHALTLLQLAEVCIEGIPQLIFEADLFLSENQTFYKGLEVTQIWAIGVSLVAVSISITSVTTTLDREEDVRETYDEKLKEGNRINRIQNEENLWEKYKNENTILWYFNFVIVFLGKSFEYIPRCIIYTMFAEEFGLMPLGILIGAYYLIFLGFSFSCFRKINSNDKSINSLGIISTLVGAFANLFFCFEWLFRLQWTKKYFYIRYYMLFYGVNLVLGFCNLVSSGKLIFHIILGFVSVLCQPLLFLLRMWLRGKMSENIK